MTFGGVFWYGVVVVVLSAIAGAQIDGNAIDVLITVAVNWVVFVLPVILIRNLRRKKRAEKAAA